MSVTNDDIKTAARDIFKRQVRWRRHFHQYPELSNREFETTKFIKRELRQSGVGLIPIDLETGAAAIIKGAGRKTAALRTDIDALPIAEQNNIPFKSKNAGVMHACGHDIHMAVVLGVSLVLNRFRKHLPGTVKIIFQPAEELPPGGAERMIKAGLFKNPKVEVIFGLHVDPGVRTGKISLRDGPAMASVVDFDITVKGVGGHAAAPHRGVDAIAVAAELIDSMQKVVSREVNPMEPALITFGTIAGGSARNVIAGTVKLRGTARTLSPGTLKRLPGLIRRTAAGICKARNAGYELEFLASYPVLENHPAANKILEDCYTSMFGKGKIEITPQIMGGEDFSLYLKEAKGAMFRLGIRNSRIGATKPWHASDFMADEEAIFYGTVLMAAAVFKFLQD